MDLKEFVETLSLTRYEKDALVFLGQVSSASAHEVYKATLIPKGRVYSVLGSLIDQGLAQVSPSKPKRHLVHDIKSRLRDYFAKMEADLQTKGSFIDSLSIQKTFTLESPPSVRILSGRDEHLQGLIELYRSAKKEIIQCAPLFVGSARSNRELVSAIKRGVRVKVITFGVTKQNSVILQEVIRAGASARTLVSPDLLSVCIVDRKEFLIGVQDYHSNEERLNLQSTNRAVLETLHNSFDKLWNRAKSINLSSE